MTRLESDYYAYMGYDPANSKAGLRHYVPYFAQGPVLELACGRGELLALLRDPASGALTAAAGINCWTAITRNGCAAARGLLAPDALLVPRDGRNVYAVTTDFALVS